MIASSLQIMLWDKEIGRLSWDARRGVSFFEYNPAFLGGRLDPFPLVASVKSPASRRPIMGDKETKLYRKLPPFLADSLPDAWGNQVFECWRIQNGIRNQEITPLEILSFIGKRGMGALEFIPESSGIRKSEKLNMKLLTDLAQRIFLERAIFPWQNAWYPADRRNDEVTPWIEAFVNARQWIEERAFKK
jgi:serine/threonine-protein kinase HipA